MISNKKELINSIMDSLHDATDLDSGVVNKNYFYSLLQLTLEDVHIMNEMKDVKFIAYSDTPIEYPEDICQELLIRPMVDAIRDYITENKSMISVRHETLKQLEYKKAMFEKEGRDAAEIVKQIESFRKGKVRRFGFVKITLE